MQTAHASSGVRIMSIHKSKGLEFPVVILSDLARRFSNMDFLSSVLVHPQLGLGPVCVDTQRHIQYPTVARQALERLPCDRRVLDVPLCVHAHRPQPELRVHEHRTQKVHIAEATREVREDHDRKFEALRLVDRHDANA